jgi:hypothetical protein
VRQGKVGVFCLEAENPDHETRIATTIAIATVRIRAARAVGAATKMRFDFVKRAARTRRSPVR